MAVKRSRNSPFPRPGWLYDLDTLLDGSRWECRRGIDFDPDLTGVPSAASFRSGAMNAAARRRMNIATSVKDENTVILEAGRKK